MNAAKRIFVETLNSPSASTLPEASNVSVALVTSTMENVAWVSLVQGSHLSLKPLKGLKFETVHRTEIF